MKRIPALLWNYDTELVELLLGWIFFGIGCILLWPVSTFTAYNGYRLLAISGLPEWVWGATAVLGGGSLWYAHANNNNQLRQTATLVLASYSFIFGFLILCAGPISPGSWVYTSLALVAAWCHLRRGRA